MLERTKCGACGSHRLLRIPTTPGDHSHITTGARLLHTIAVDKYVCIECGRVDEWVGSDADLKHLRAEFDRAEDDHHD
jgi:DNA-directed RNA polymerase subunit RPC12/RpoP